MWKILVFGNDDGLMREGVSPDAGIICIPKADIGNVPSGVAMPDQKQGEGRRQLSSMRKRTEDQRARSTGWSACAAA